MSASPKPRSVFSAVCRSNGIVLGRTRATVGSRFSLNASLASASHPQSVAVLPTSGNVIRAFISLWRGRLAGKLERSRPYSARFPALVTSYEGPRAGFMNLCRRLKVSGNLSSFRIPFVDHCSEATNSITHAFRFSPVVVGQVHLSKSAAPSGLVAVSDGHRGSERKIGNVRKSSGEIRNVIR